MPHEYRRLYLWLFGKKFVQPATSLSAGPPCPSFFLCATWAIELSTTGWPREPRVLLSSIFRGAYDETRGIQDRKNLGLRLSVCLSVCLLRLQLSCRSHRIRRSKIRVTLAKLPRARSFALMIPPIPVSIISSFVCSSVCLVIFELSFILISSERVDSIADEFHPAHLSLNRSLRLVWRANAINN